LERLPLPEGSVEPLSPSLVLHDEALIVALVLRRRAAVDRIVVLEQGQQGWTYDTLPVLFAVEAGLGRGAEGRPLLALVQPDLTLPTDGNSLFLWRRGETWTSLGKLVASQREAVNHPALGTGSRGDVVLSWKAQPSGTRRSELHAMANPERVPRPPVLTVDSAISFHSPRAPIPLGAEYFFVTDHVLENGHREVRLNRLARDGVQLVSILRPESTIAFPFGAARADDSTIVVVGGTGETGINMVLALYPNLFFLPTFSVIYPEVQRFRVTCTPDRP
jgi:hypothetical protein